VVPGLVALLSHQRDQVSVPTLAEQVLPHLAIFGKAARIRLVRKVDLAAQRAAERDPATFEHHRQTGTHDAFIRFLRTPEEAARQGRTQVYQAIARAAGKAPGRRGALSPDQMALFDDLIEELQQVDEVTDTEDENEDEEDGQ
jgi:hypothetical protein